MNPIDKAIEAIEEGLKKENKAVALHWPRPFMVAGSVVAIPEETALEILDDLKYFRRINGPDFGPDLCNVNPVIQSANISIQSLMEDLEKAQTEIVQLRIMVEYWHDKAKELGCENESA